MPLGWIFSLFAFPFTIAKSIFLLLCFEFVLSNPLRHWSVVKSTLVELLEYLVCSLYTSTTRRIHLPKHRTPKQFTPSICFMGGGQLWMFAIGVGHYVYKNFDISQIKFLASSSGCFAAVPLACGLDPYEWCKRDWGKCMAHFSSRGVLTCLYDTKHFYYDLWNDYLPRDAHIKCTGRLFISVTLFPSMKNRVVSIFKTRDELVWTIVASMCLPYVFIRDFPVMCAPEVGMAFDGGFSNDSPCLDSYSITVSALHMEADIKPNMTQTATSNSDEHNSDDNSSPLPGDNDQHCMSYDATAERESQQLPTTQMGTLYEGNNGDDCDSEDETNNIHIASDSVWKDVEHSPVHTHTTTATNTSITETTAAFDHCDSPQLHYGQNTEMSAWGLLSALLTIASVTAQIFKGCFIFPAATLLKASTSLIIDWSNFITQGNTNSNSSIKLDSRSATATGTDISVNQKKNSLHSVWSMISTLFAVSVTIFCACWSFPVISIFKLTFGTVLTPSSRQESATINNAIADVAPVTQTNINSSNSGSSSNGVVFVVDAEAEAAYDRLIRIRPIDIITVPVYERVWEVGGIGFRAASKCVDFERYEWTSIRFSSNSEDGASIANCSEATSLVL